MSGNKLRHIHISKGHAMFKNARKNTIQRAKNKNEKNPVQVWQQAGFALFAGK